MIADNDDRIRAFLADEARRAVAAAGSLDEAVGRLAPRIERRPAGASQRLIVLMAATLLVVAALGSAIAIGSGVLRLPLVIDPSTVSPFEGTWISTSDADGGTQTMIVRVLADGVVDIAVRDTIATVCSGASSIMTGTGTLEGGTRIVVPAPVYTCDDGSQPEALNGGRLEALLRDWTLTLDPRAGTLNDRTGGVWHREGAAVPPESSFVPTALSPMWPQANLEEVREAQELADAGDPAYTWQVDAGLASLDYPGAWDRLRKGEVELVDRFLREVLGWEAYVTNGLEGGADFSLTDQRFLRCAPGQTNPLYPPQPESQNPGESCAPTLDELTYESVGLDLVQPGRQGPGGIWVVSNSRPTTFAQVDPAVAEAKATERLEQFLAARVAGRGAEGIVDVYAQWVEPQIPLLYATTSGSPYERSEFERVAGPGWPYGGYIEYRIRLYAQDGTVVEQEIYSHWDGGASVGIEGGLALGLTPTMEDGQRVPMLFAEFGGEVTFWSPSYYSMDIGDPRDRQGLIDFTDPAVFWSECADGPVPADAAAFAQAVIADPNFEATAPVGVRIGEVEAVAMDVALAPSGRVCLAYRTDAHRWVHALKPGNRLRLFLVDLPEGMSMRTLAITVIASEEDFEGVAEEASSIIDSIEFHPG